MKFIEGHRPAHDLTYEDVFIEPQLSDVRSRSEVDLTPHDGTGNTIPIVVANMNAVAGSRMAETVARRGGIVALSQDLSPQRLAETIREVKAAHPVYDTPLTLTPDHSIKDALDLIPKRAHGAVLVVDKQRRPTGVFTETDSRNHRLETTLGEIVLPDLIMIDEGTPPREAHDFLKKNRLKLAPVVYQGELVGVLTEKGAVRADIYTPNVDKYGKLKVIATVGINGDTEKSTTTALEAGADIIMVDTAHGHQIRMGQALEVARKTAGPDITIIAGNVVTAEGTRFLIKSGANIVKVGVGPGAMCTTRMMTGVGRPQFSAVLDCATEAHKLEATVLADGGIQHPRDVAFAIAAGAKGVVIGSWFAPTYESEADMHQDDNGFYKVNFGMASTRAVKDRYSELDSFTQAKKELYQEGIEAKMYLDTAMPGVEDIIDYIIHGVQSTFTYTGARNLKEFYEKVVVGIQSAAGFQEGRPLDTSW